MELSATQAEAVDKVHTWFKGEDMTPQVFRLDGYAGTGKTTIARHFGEGLETVYATYTGKAASVLNKKGVTASTIHRLIYRVKEPSRQLLLDLRTKMKDATGEDLGKLKAEYQTANQPQFVLRDREEMESIDLIIIDEYSMVGEILGSDLMSFGIKILLLGDPGQLPPVGSEIGFFVKGDADVVLTEIHRQARGNPIINMATMVRQGHRLRPGDYGSSRVINRHKFSEKLYLDSDQIICGSNNTRRGINSIYRDMLGYYGVAGPVEKDKVICLRNNHDLGILNGTQWNVEKVTDEGAYIDLELQPWGEDPYEKVKLVSCHPFDVELKELSFYEQKKYESFDFGYAITCHKSQGSQWPRVCIRDESFMFRQDSVRWLYTAITRAEETVVVIV